MFRNIPSKSLLAPLSRDAPHRCPLGATLIAEDAQPDQRFTTGADGVHVDVEQRNPWGRTLPEPPTMTVSSSCDCRVVPQAAAGIYEPKFTSSHDAAPLTASPVSAARPLSRRSWVFLTNSISCLRVRL